MMKKSKVLPYFMCSILLAASLNNSILVLASDVTPNQEKNVENMDSKGNFSTLESNMGSAKSQSVIAADESVDSWMPDKNVQNAVAKTLGITVSELTKEKVSELGTQPGFNQVNITGATSLQGLEYATGGTSFVINATNGTLSDLTPLTGVILAQLNIKNNNVSDLSPLRGKALTSFLADDNEISNLSPLNFSKLSQISVDNNHISDISVIPQSVSMVVARNQTITNLPVSRTSPFVLDTASTVSNYDLTDKNFSNISNLGQFSQGTAIYKGKITWDSLDSSISQVTYGFDRQYSFSQDSSKSNKVYFSGTVVQPFSSSIVAADVTVNYVDEDGKAIPSVSSQTISGNIGDSYDATTDAYKLTIEGYTLDESKLPTNAKGTLSDQAQTVTYVYTKNPVKAADVTVNYIDEDGKAIPSVSPQTISGNVGDSYDATTDAYKLTIEGYTLDESKLPTNAKGTLSDKPQTVTYVYKQTKDQSTVIVHDSELTIGDSWKPEDNFDSALDYYGNVVPFSDINVEGEVDTTKAGTYKITYTRFVPNFFSNSENQGTYSAVATVTVKDAPPVKGGDVTAKYIDTDGNKVSDDVVKSGNVGDDYTTEQKAIEGYTFKEVQGNAAGQFTDQAQTVTYVYTKNEIPNITGTVLVQYVDTDGNKISEDIMKSGTVGEGYSTEKKDIKGYTFKEVQGNTTGQFTDQVQTITYVYTKNKVNPVKPENKPDSKDKNNDKGTTSSTQHSLPATGENERMTLMSIILGLILLALGVIVSIFRFKKVNK